MDRDDDANLVARVQAGDRPAFGVLIDRHRADAIAFARRLVSRADAEDVVQDALLFLELEAIHQKGIADGKAEEVKEMEWRSVRSLPRAEGLWAKTQA